MKRPRCCGVWKPNYERCAHPRCIAAFRSDCSLDQHRKITGKSPSNRRKLTVRKIRRRFSAPRPCHVCVGKGWGVREAREAKLIPAAVPATAAAVAHRRRRHSRRRRLRNRCFRRGSPRRRRRILLLRRRLPSVRRPARHHARGRAYRSRRRAAPSPRSSAGTSWLASRRIGMSLRAMLPSPGSMNECAHPLFPARPVRPILWT